MAGIIFAAGLLLGIPAVACVSALIAFVHYIQRRPSWYKTLFNWSAHTLAVAIARALGLSQQQVEHVRQAAFMHDIGKLEIPGSLLHKPARLTGEEYVQIKRHAQLGADFLETCAGLRHLAPFVKHHHEWWNGNGYPERLAGEQIPLEARILALADAVEAMASDRPYHRAMFLSEIIAEIECCGGTQFDPIIARACAKILRRDGKDLVVNSARRVTQKQGSHVFAMAPFPDFG